MADASNAMDNETVRQGILSSVFATRLTEQTYVAHIKLWESDANEPGGLKPRFIIISSTLLPLVDLAA